MGKRPKRDEDCCVEILAVMRGRPTPTDEIVRQFVEQGFSAEQVVRCLKDLETGMWIRTQSGE